MAGSRDCHSRSRHGKTNDDSHLADTCITCAIEGRERACCSTVTRIMTRFLRVHGRRATRNTACELLRTASCGRIFIFCYGREQIWRSRGSCSGSTGTARVDVSTERAGSRGTGAVYQSRDSSRGPILDDRRLYERPALRRAECRSTAGYVDARRRLALVQRLARRDRPIALRSSIEPPLPQTAKLARNP